MKKLSLILFLVLITSAIYGQDITYKQLTDLPYYGEELRKTDIYLSDRCVLDIYYPENTKDFATIVWFHGGGITGGVKEIPEALKNQGFAIIGVNYRLSPKVKAPKYIEDAAAAIAWTFKNITEYGGDPKKIFISGHSAGGYLASMVGLDKSYLNTHGIDANEIAGMVPFSGHTITHFTVRKEQGISGEQPTIDKYAPLFHVRKDAPPLLLITGDRELELLGRYEENAYLMRMMKVVGHQETVLYEMDGYGHGMTHPAFPLLIKEVKRILAK